MVLYACRSVQRAAALNVFGIYGQKGNMKTILTIIFLLLAQPVASLPVPELTLETGAIPATIDTTHPVDLAAKPSSPPPSAPFTDLTVNLAPHQDPVVTIEPDLGQTPTTSLMAPRREPRPPGASIWVESEEETSLVQLIEAAIRGTPPGPVFIPISNRDQFSRPDQLKREPGLRIFSWRF
jgi:hypothetical protein